jgi:Tol biopolymer transport system component
MITTRMAGWSLLAAAGTFAVSTPAAAAPAAARVLSTERISVAADGTQGDGASLLPSTDAAGRYVAFLSDAANLVPGDTNGHSDVFLRDTRLNTVELISRGRNGTPANGNAGLPRISSDGRFVVYYSQATNVVADPAGPQAIYNVYVYDRTAGTTERIPAGDHGGMSADISGDGRYVTYQSFSGDVVPDADGDLHVYAYDRQEGTTTLVSRAADGSPAQSGGDDARISGDGRYVAFLSWSADLVPGDTNDEIDVFVRDLRTETTARVSVATDGTQGDGWSAEPSISADGRTIAFASEASTLTPGDTNGDYDVFVHDAVTGATTLISHAYDGSAAGFGFSYSPDISDDGTHVAFWSSVWNLVPDDTNWVGDTFVYDLAARSATRVSVTSDGAQAGGSDAGVITAGGEYVFYRASAPDLVPDDTNNVDDVFRSAVQG